MKKWLRHWRVVGAAGIIVAAAGVARGEHSIFDMDDAPPIPTPEPPVEGAGAPPPSVSKRLAATPPAEAARHVSATQPSEGPARAPAARPRVKIPAVAEVSAARAAADEVYGDAFKQAKSELQKAALADRLQRAVKTEPAAAARYVLLLRSRDLWAEAGDAQRVGDVVAEMGREFELQEWKLAAETVGTLRHATMSAPQKVGLAAFGAKYALGAIQAADFREAQALADAGVAAVQGLPDAKLAGQARTMAEGAKEGAALEEAVTAAAPGNAAGNPQLGKYLCLYRNDWKAGLVKLAAGSDAGLAEAAKRELAGAEGAEAKVALGDLWWKLGQSAGDFEKERLWEHAGGIYKEALAGISGGTKDQVMKRLAMAGMEVLPVPDFIIAYLDSVAAKLPKGNEPFNEFRQKMSAAARGSTTAFRINGQDRTFMFLGRIYGIVVDGGGGKPAHAPSIARFVGVQFEYHGMLAQFIVRDQRKIQGWKDPLVAEWIGAAKAGQVYEVDAKASGFAAFTMLPAADGRMRMTMSPVTADRKPAEFTVKERQ